jgi:hypothetical protein
MKFGSHLYGTTTPDSDLDFKAVYIPAAIDIIMQRAKGGIGVPQPQKGEGVKNEPGEIDSENYSLQRYLQLLSEGQTVGIDMLFAPADAILESSVWWEGIVENKDQLLTKKSAAFVGYCRGQANKYSVKGSRMAAARKAAEAFNGWFTRLGATTKVSDVADALPALFDDHTRCVEAPIDGKGTLGWYFECCNKKVCFTASVKQGYEIYSHVLDGYGRRAQRAEQCKGVDWKALSHAVRVGHEALELLTTGKVTFPLPNAEHVLKVKIGELPYDVVAEEIESLLGRVEDAVLTSSLPEKANQDFIDETVFQSNLYQVIDAFE